MWNWTRRCLRSGAFAGNVALLVFLGATGAMADDWPQWRGPNRDGVSAETNWLVNWPPVTVWTQDVQYGYSAVSVASNRLYTMGWNSNTMQDIVYCMDSLDGTQMWTHVYESAYSDAYSRDFPGPRATPTVDGDRVYVHGHLGHVFCLDAYSGTVIWTNFIDAGRPAYGHSSSPLIEGDLLLLNAGRDGVAIDKNTGTNVWGGVGPRYTAGYSSPFVIDWQGQRVAVLFTYSGLDGVNAETGEKLWWYEAEGHFNVPDPIVYDDKVFITNLDDSHCYLLKLVSGEMTKLPGDPQMYTWFCSPVRLGNYLYGFHFKTTLTCLDMRDGSTLWAERNIDLSEGGLIAAVGNVLVIWELGDLAVIEATPTSYNDGGRPIVKVVPGAESEEWHTAPTLANGMIYCRSRHGSLVCLRTGPPAADIDRNGVADNWERLHFAAGSVGSGAGDDRDRDGLDNRTEYIVGTIPTNGNSRYGLRIAASNGDVIVHYDTIQAVGVGYEGFSRYYRLEEAAEVSADGWHAVGGHTDVPGNGARRVHTNDTPGPSGAYRIGVRLEADPGN